MIAKKENIWIFTFEYAGIVKVGGLGEVPANQAKHLANDYNITVFIPSHGQLKNLENTLEWEKLPFNCVGQMNPFQFGINEPETTYNISFYRSKINNVNIILLHGDLIFSNNLLKEIIDSEYHDCVLINKEIAPPEKDFKALIIDEKINQISVDISDPNTVFLAPLYKLSYRFFKAWLNQIEKFIIKNQFENYAEDALNTILDELVLKPFYFNNKICKEIDNIDDLNLVKKLLKK